MKKRASVTVFFSMLMIIFLMLFQVLLYSVQIQGGKLQAEAGVQEGLYSAFAEYDRELFERFHIFSLEGGYGTDALHMDRAYEIVEESLKESCFPKGIMDIRGENLWNCKMGTGGITKYTLASDGKGREFRKQAVGYMADTAGIQGVHFLIDEGKKVRENMNTISSEDQAASATENAIAQSGQSSEETTGEENSTPAVPENFINPLDVLGNIKKRGILLMTLPASAEISEKCMADDLYSTRDLNKGMKVEENQTDNDLYSQLLFNKYITSHFKCYGEEAGESVDYQLEYIIAGKDSDIKNLKAVTHRLVLLRMLPNSLYLMKDRKSQCTIQNMAGIIAVLLENPEVKDAAAAALTSAWAYAESIMDVRRLMNGEKVTLIKDNRTWRTEINETGRLNTGIGNGDDPGGKSYEEYLEMLLYTVSLQKKTDRTINLVEMIMRQQMAQKNFRMDMCIVCMEVEMEVCFGRNKFSIIREYGYDV